MDSEGITAKRVAPPVPVTPPATISLEGLTTKQARQLLGICKINIDVPRVTVAYHERRGINVGTTDDLNDLLHALSDALERAGVHI